MNKLQGFAATLLSAAVFAAPAMAADWDTPESIRGGMELFATFDSSGPDAWDVAAHPLVYFTSQSGDDMSPLKKARPTPGFQIIDAYTKEPITAVGFDLIELEKAVNPGTEVTVQAMVHGIGVSPDGQWVYIPTGINAEHGITSINKTARLLVVNARTLKLKQILVPENGNHHVMSFVDWEGNPRMVTGNNWGSTFILDPNDDNRVVKAITTDDVPGIPSSRGTGIGHPYITVDPTGKYLYQPLRPSGAYDGVAGIAKVNLETDEIAFIWGLGHNGNPIGQSHTADGKFTYVNDGHNSHTYKIDNETNEIVKETSSGVAGPYGNCLNWDESLLFTVGKGESSHNTGNVLGAINTKIFRQFSPGGRFNMPISLGPTARSVDHCILHPDPEVKEIWVSNMRGWTTIVLDLETLAVKTVIEQINGGDTHSGAFVKYDKDWNGEVLVDQGGPHKAMYARKIAMMK